MNQFIGMLVLLLCLFHVEGTAQSEQKAVVEIKNSSFEGKARAGTVNGRPHRGWYDCGAEDESVPDIQPLTNSEKTLFEVTTPPYQGKTYLGMVVRRNDTWEALEQNLANPLKVGRRYKIEVALTKSAKYISPSREGPGMTNHDGSCVFRVWGGFGRCGGKELLVNSQAIKHLDWQVYEFFFEPKEAYDHLIVEAYYDSKAPVIPYYGNLLIDDLNLFLLNGEPKTGTKEEEKPSVAQTETRRELRKISAFVKPEPIISMEEKLLLEKTKTPIRNLKALKRYVREEGEPATFSYQTILKGFLLKVANTMQDYENKKLIVGVTGYELEEKTHFLKSIFEELAFKEYEIRQLGEEPDRETLDEYLSYNYDFCWTIENK